MEDQTAPRREGAGSFCASDRPERIAGSIAFFEQSENFWNTYLTRRESCVIHIIVIIYEIKENRDYDLSG